jgi:hypothetical protein
MTDEHQDHDEHHQEHGDGEGERPLSSAPTPDYGAPWLPISPPRQRS